MVEARGGNPVQRRLGICPSVKTSTLVQVLEDRANLRQEELERETRRRHAQVCIPSRGVVLSPHLPAFHRVTCSFQHVVALEQHRRAMLQPARCTSFPHACYIMLITVH